MTVNELAERITIDEVSEWAAVSRLDAEEGDERRKREELKSKVNQGVNDARSKLRARKRA